MAKIGKDHQDFKLIDVFTPRLKKPDQEIREALAETVNVIVDAVRVAGVSEFLAVSLMARKAGVPVVPHVGDMGQLHQHLVLFNHIGMGHEALFLEHIPHLRKHFIHPVEVRGGVYRTPQEIGSGCDLY